MIVWFVCFFFKDTATTKIYTLSLHDALPIYSFEIWAFQLGFFLSNFFLNFFIFEQSNLGWK